MLPIIYRGNEQAGFFVHALGHNVGQKLVSLLPGNQRSDDARYACLVPVRDYWRMHGPSARQHSSWHYSDGIDPEILADMRAGRAVLVFDLSNEGPAYDPSIFDELYAWMEAHALPGGSVVWLAQNRTMPAAAAAQAGPRAALVRHDHYDFFVKAMTYIFSKPDAPVLGHDPAAAAERMFDPAAKDSLLLCLNATPRLHRVLTVAGLIHYGLLAGSQVSFPGLMYEKAGASMQAVGDFVDRHPSLHYLRPALDRVAELADLRVDQFEETGNALFAKIDPRPYERSFFSLVTESEFTDGSVDRITEKIAKAFCMGHPTLVVGNPHSIRFMTELGFQDWTGTMDRGFDAIRDPAARFDAVFREVLRQAIGVRMAPADWLGRVREVGSHNIRLSVSGGLMRNYIALYDVPVVARLKASVGL
jgi:hypothetical protein